jgi:ATP-dependent DNA helicase RecG
LVFPRIGDDDGAEATAQKDLSDDDEDSRQSLPSAKTTRADLTSLMAEYKKLLPDHQVGILHGRLPEKEREKVMEDFRSGALRVLAATTMIEVGVDVPSANVMLVEGAEFFGLAQLHQLRGRVGRAGLESTFLVLPHSLESAITQERLKALAENNDGYALAELDLKLRGPGEEMGLKQSGWPNFRFAKLPAHISLLPRAMELAEDLWESRILWSKDFLEALEHCRAEVAHWSTQGLDAG